MSKNVAMFVDVANMYYAARGQDVDVDYVALLKHATKGRDLIRAYAYTGLDPENENQRKFIDFLGKNGYKPVIKDIRKFGDGRMKANLDIELVVDLFRLADRMDIAVIVSGDGDFAPAIKALQDKGVRAEVISFKPNTSSDLIAVADEFTDIMKIASISRKEGRALRDSMSAPEMPAKEVTPEFGFREASPSVAAAALAAIKGNGGRSETVPAARRGRGGTRRAAAPSEQPPGEAVATVVEETAADAEQAGDETRRRRRRRGGRGRGRGRHEEEVVAGEPASEEVGWEEFDDLSQLDGAEERDYTFEEADASTLAELGLSEEELAALTTSGEGAEAVEEQPKRRTTRSRKAAEPEAAARAEGDNEVAEEQPKRRTTRSRKAAAPAAEAEGDNEVAEEQPKRRTTRSRKAADPAPSASESESESESAESKPKRRTTRSRAAATPSTDDAAPSEASAADATREAAGGEPQGIWGRFRSARKPRGAAGA